jgi:hypothetical protein
MINQLASPSVCVIDDEPDDFGPILAALNDLFVSYILIQGNNIERLPAHPFTRLQLVFLDLHLSNTLGKDAASYTANVFTKVVSADTAPVVVVIWSKYAGDLVAQKGVPPEDQETESELFKRTLFEAEPKFRNRLIFLEMEKPKKDRPANWSDKLQEAIKATLGDQSAIDLLWAWDSLVKDSNAALMASLTNLAEESAGGADPELTDADMKEVLQRLTKAQSEGDLSAQNAPGNLVAVLSQLLADQLEHAGSSRALVAHGTWLSQPPASKTKASVSGKMNGFLLTAAPSDGATPYMPGTVYRATDSAEFCRTFGVTNEMLEKLFCNQQRQQNAARVDEWNAAVKPIVYEISPVCDVANGKRFHALLLGGLVVPAGKKPHLVTKSDALAVLPGNPNLSLRWPLAGFNTDETLIVLCHRLRVSIKVDPMPAWLVPWFRLRELPTTSLRNLHMAYASRVGIVSMA